MDMSLPTRGKTKNPVTIMHISGCASLGNIYCKKPDSV